MQTSGTDSPRLGSHGTHSDTDGTGRCSRSDNASGGNGRAFIDGNKKHEGETLLSEFSPPCNGNGRIVKADQNFFGSFLRALCLWTRTASGLVFVSSARS